MYGTAAALLFSLSVLSRFPVCRDSVAEKRMHHALGAKGEPLLRIHLKPQRLGGNVHSSCPRVRTNATMLLNLYLLQRSAEYLDSRRFFDAAPGNACTEVLDLQS